MASADGWLFPDKFETGTAKLVWHRALLPVLASRERGEGDATAACAHAARRRAKVTAKITVAINLFMALLPRRPLVTYLLPESHIARRRFIEFGWLPKARKLLTIEAGDTELKANNRGVGWFRDGVGISAAVAGRLAARG
jgi:hypothetical protein